MKIPKLLITLLSIPSLLAIGNPPALAEHDVVNGCTGVRDSWFNVNFKPACDNHDRCYGTLGEPKLACDAKFWRDVEKICADNTRNKYTFGTCSSFALGLFSGVSWLGNSSYEASQKHAQEQNASPVTPIRGDLSFDSRFRAINDWASARGYVSAFPNFHQADHGQGLVYGGVLLKPGTAEIQTVPMAELGNPSTNEERFRAINDWAGRNGYAAAFPNFHQADYGKGVVFGVVLLKPGNAEIRDVPVSELR